MTKAPLLTDRKALTRARARALRGAPALFFHDEAAAEIKERLIEVNRRFTAPAVVTGFPDLWAASFPEARVVADDETLDLAEGAHDLVIHAMALHWANDPVGQIVQCRRALRPDGLFIAVLFGGQTLAELRATLAEAEAALTGGLSPRILPMGEIRDWGGLLQRAGLALPVADASLRKVSYRNAFHLMADLRAMGEANALAARRRTPARRGVFVDAARSYAAAFSEAGDRVLASFELIYLTGWAPHDSQQQPLRPGTARYRLADALSGATLTPAPMPGSDN